MGLSSSKSTTNTNQNTTGSEVTSGTQTPVTPDWLLGPTRDYVERIGAFGDMDPNSLVAPASQLQQQAWQTAGQLPNWHQPITAATQAAQGVVGQGPNTAGAAQTMAAPTIARTDPVTGAQIAPNRDAQTVSGASQMQQYQNPYQQQVIDAALADFDSNAGQVRAQQAAQGAGSGAFGGSRFAIREAQTEGDLARARVGTSANLRAQGFREAAGLGMMDADRSGQASLFNAGQANQRNAQQAGFDQQAGLAGYQGDLQRNLAQAGMQADANQFNAGAQNQFSMFNAGQRDNAATRDLQGAGVLADIANSQAGNTRADLGLQAQLGEQQRSVEQQQALAPLAQLQAMGQLSGMTPYDILVGRQVNGTSNTAGTLNGTNVTKTSPSLFNSLIGLGSLIPFQGGIKI